MATWANEAVKVSLAHTFESDLRSNRSATWAQGERTSVLDADCDNMTAAELLDVVTRWHGRLCHAQWAVRTYSDALAHSPEVSRGRRWEDALASAAAELAMRLGISSRAARALVRDGAAFRGALADVGALAESGAIDASKTSVFIDELYDVDFPVALAVLDQLLPEAPSTPPAELRREVQRVLVQVDPDGDAERTKHATGQRRVDPVRPRGHGMASFYALLPAPVAGALEKVCESAARAAHGKGDSRTLEQLRADVLAAMSQQAIVTGVVGIEGRTDDVFTFDPARAKVRVVATKRAQAGLPETSITAVDPYLWELYSAESGDEDGESPYDGWTAPTSCRPGYDVPELVGVGAIPPRMVEAIRDRCWVSVTEPVDLDHPPDAVTTYKPSAALDRYVRTRDRTCQAPGCFVDAWRCDLDHVITWPAGPTSAGNLMALCRLHHRLRTHEGHSYRLTASRVVIWTTPLGQVFRRLPQGWVTEGEWPGGGTVEPGAIGDLADWREDEDWSEAV